MPKILSENEKLIGYKLTAMRVGIALLLAVPAVCHVGYKIVRRHASPKEVLALFRMRTWKMATEPVLFSGRWLVDLPNGGVEEGDSLPPHTYRINGNTNKYVCHRKSDSIEMKLRYLGEVTDRKTSKTFNKHAY